MAPVKYDEDDEKTWRSSARLVLAELQRLNQNYESLNKSVDEIKTDLTKVKAVWYSIDEIKEDIKAIFTQLNVTPSQDTNSFGFKNYFRKTNYTDRVVYNGNSSFFLEPMEATSIVFMAWIADIAKSKLLNNIDEYNSNERYKNLIKSVENVISIHYLNNTNFDTKFWNYAKNISNETIDNSLKTNLEFKNVIVNVLSNLNNNIEQVPSWGYGTWGFGAPGTDSLRLWSQTNYGEDLIFGPRGGGIYYWSAAIGPTPDPVTISNASPAKVTYSTEVIEPVAFTVLTFAYAPFPVPPVNMIVSLT